MRPSRGGSTLVHQGYAAAIREHQQCSFLVSSRLSCKFNSTRWKTVRMSHSQHSGAKDSSCTRAQRTKRRSCREQPYDPSRFHRGQNMLYPGSPTCDADSRLLCYLLLLILLRASHCMSWPTSTLSVLFSPLWPPCRHSMQSISYPYLALSTLQQVREVQASSAQCAGRRLGKHNTTLSSNQF